MFVEHKGTGEQRALDKVGTLILRAAELIEQYGHRKNDLGGPERGFCVVGALNFAETGDATMWGKMGTEAYTLVTDDLRYLDIIEWNNNPRTSKADVIATLRSIAAKQA